MEYGVTATQANRRLDIPTGPQPAANQNQSADGPPAGVILDSVRDEAMRLCQYSGELRDRVIGSSQPTPSEGVRPSLGYVKDGLVSIGTLNYTTKQNLEIIAAYLFGGI